MLFLAISLSAWAMPTQPCGTMDHMTEFLSAERPPPVAPSTELIDHESHGGIPNTRYSEHFALKWGSDFDFSEEDAERLLNDFEFAHSVQVVEWEMDEPTGVGGTYFNVYIGDSGSPVPSALGNAGYYTSDDFGYPMIVMNKDILSDASYTKSVVAHEFFHAVQYASRAYYDWSTGGWYWEATATWAQGEAVPESNAYAGFLAFYALQPHVGLYHHSLDDFGGAPPDLHQYGAFIFPRFLSEHMDSGTAVMDSWRYGTEYEDPARFLRTYMSPALFNAAYVDHAAHNLTWDYEHSDMYKGWVDAYADWWPDSDFRTNELSATDDSDWYTPPEGLTLAPASYGLVSVPEGWSDDGQLTVRVEPNTADGDDGGANFIGRLVRLDDGVPTYIALSATAEHDTATVGTEGELWLAVANVATIDECPAPVPFKVSFLRRDDPPPEDTGSPPPEDTGLEDTGTEPEESDDSGIGPDTGSPDSGDDVVLPDVAAHDSESEGNETKGCGCATQSGHSALFWLVVPLLAMRRRGTPKA